MVVTVHKICECGRRHKEVKVTRKKFRIDPEMKVLIEVIDRKFRERGLLMTVESVRTFVPKGGSLRAFVSRKGQHEVDPFVDQVARSEYDIIRAPERYGDFAERVKESRRQIRPSDP